MDIKIRFEGLPRKVLIFSWDTIACMSILDYEPALNLRKNKYSTKINLKFF